MISDEKRVRRRIRPMPLLILRASRQPTLKRDFDREKKGRKRKIATDTFGLSSGRGRS